MTLDVKFYLFDAGNLLGTNRPPLRHVRLEPPDEPVEVDEDSGITETTPFDVAIARIVQSLEGGSNEQRYNVWCRIVDESGIDLSDEFADTIQSCTCGPLWEIPDDVPTAKVIEIGANPYAKYLDDGSMDMYDIDIYFDNRLRESRATILRINPLTVEDPNGVPWIVNVAPNKVWKIGDQVTAVFGRSQTTYDGRYCEIL